MTWLFVVAAIVGVTMVALLAVGGEVFTLSRQPRQALFDVDEAVDHVAERLPVEMAARLSYDDVRALLRWHLAYLRDEGVPEDRSAAVAGLVVVADDESLARLLARADETGLDVTDDEVLAVLDAELDYFRAIGAIGPEIAGSWDRARGRTLSSRADSGELDGPPGPAGPAGPAGSPGSSDDG